LARRYNEWGIGVYLNLHQTGSNILHQGALVK